MNQYKPHECSYQASALEELSLSFIFGHSSAALLRKPAEVREPLNLEITKLQRFHHPP